MILMALSGGPLTLEEIKDHFFALPRRFGFFAPLYRMTADDDQHFAWDLQRDVERLVERRWIRRQEDRYDLTDLGRELAHIRLAGIRRALNLAVGLIRPETVSRAAVGIHLLLAAVKLPAALLSGSVGLLNDAIDTLLDGIASLLVYFGVRFQKERAANVVLVAMMLITGGFALFESVRRLFFGEAPVADGFAFLSAALSGFVCLLLGAYQRYAGLQHRSMALIAQSVDSRNHVLVAAGVTAGLIASLLRFPLLDTAVGIAVAGLILRSGIELAIGLFRSWEGGEADLARYPMPFAGKFEALRRTQLRDWMLYLVDARKAETRDGLREQVARSMTFDRYPVLREIGLPDPEQTEADIAHAVEDIFENGWLIETDGALTLSPAGKRRLQWQTGSIRRVMSRSLLPEESNTTAGH